MAMELDESVFSEALIAEFQQVNAQYGEVSNHLSDEPMEINSSAGSVVDREDSDGADLVREDEEAEKKRVNKFTCDCHFGPKSTACSTLFSRELLATTCMNCRELNRVQLDLVVLANLEAHQHCKDQESHRSHVDYYFCGHKVCKCTFLFVHSLTRCSFC